jgi:hypothetical protein
MKIALCISGLLRTFEKNFPNLEKFFIQKYHPDIFVHTWSQIDRDVKIKNFQKKIEDVYKPKKLLIEEPCNFHISQNIQNLNYGKYDINGVLSMYYSINKSINLIDENYDTVIRFRGDCLLKHNFDLLEINNSIVIPLYGNFSGCNDQIAYGSQENMKLYAECFNNINNYCSEGAEFCPEKLLNYHIQKNNLPVEKQDIDYDIVWYNGHIHNMKQKEIDMGFITAQNN